jgi:hypothetical protein
MLETIGCNAEVGVAVPSLPDGLSDLFLKYEFARSGDIGGRGNCQGAFSLVGVPPPPDPDRFLPLADFLTRRMYSPSLIPEPPLKPYDFVRISFAPKVWNEEKLVEVGGGEGVAQNVVCVRGAEVGE